MMPLDDTKPPLTECEVKILSELFACFGRSRFITRIAADALNRRITNMARHLGILVAKGALFRASHGVYSFIDIGYAVCPRQHPISVPKDRPVPDAVADDKTVIEEERRRKLDIIVSTTIIDTDHALAWLRLFGAPVEHVGNRFRIDGRQPVTAEQLIIVAERRRTNKQRYPDQWPRTHQLPTDIPEPSAQARMRGR